MQSKTISAILLSLFGPLAAATIYLIFSRWPSRWFTAMSDYSALTIALLVGLGGLVLLPWALTKKIIISVLYIPLTLVVLGYYSLFFVCAAFGDCL